MAALLRVAILGAGRAGAAHAAAYQRLPDVAVTAVWSRTRSRAEALCATGVAATVLDSVTSPTRAF